MTFTRCRPLEGRSAQDRKDKDDELECLFFGRSDDGCQCAVATKSVQRIDPTSDHTGEELSLTLLGFLDAADFQAPRIVRIIVGEQIVPVAMRAAITVHVVSFTELFPLPQSSFSGSIFSVLISSNTHGRALLLAPERLLNFYHSPVDPFSPVNAPSL